MEKFCKTNKRGRGAGIAGGGGVGIAGGEVGILKDFFRKKQVFSITKEVTTSCI